MHVVSCLITFLLYFHSQNNLTFFARGLCSSQEKHQVTNMKWMSGHTKLWLLSTAKQAMLSDEVKEVNMAE